MLSVGREVKSVTAWWGAGTQTQRVTVAVESATADFALKAK
jgi:hypothetical protein